MTLDGLRSLFRPSPNSDNVALKAYGIDEAQAAQLRARFSAFAEEWDAPGMEVYNDYLAAKAQTETALRHI